MDGNASAGEPGGPLGAPTANATAAPSALLEAPTSAADPPAEICLPAPEVPGGEGAMPKGDFWGAGAVLRITFIGGEQKHIDRVKKIANRWMEVANVTFKYVKSGEKSDIRIAFQAGGSWSYVGKQATHPKLASRPTMNFGWLSDQLEENNYKRVVLHEFGHALGLIHEHQSPSGNFQWNTDALKKEFGKGTKNNWSDKYIEDNIVTKAHKDSTNYGAFDKNSIMLYWFDPKLVTNGSEAIGIGQHNYDLSQEDIRFIASQYGKPKP
jgi:hypothetical protein